MNNEIQATLNTRRASTSSSDSEWILVEPPKDLILVLKGLRPVRNEIQFLLAGLSPLKTQANYEGALANRFGSEQNPACNRCRTDARVPLKYSTSRDFDGKQVFEGACAECRLAGLEVECSFHGQFILYRSILNNLTSSMSMFRVLSPRWL
jgi:hypothetical protein